MVEIKNFGRKNLTNVQLGEFYFHVNKLLCLINNGAIEYEQTLIDIQKIIGDQKVILPVLSRPSYTFSINYSKTLRKMARESGCIYKEEDVCVSAKLVSSKSGKEKITAEIFCFKKPMSSEEVKNEMDKLGFRPATIWELLGCLKIFSEISNYLPVVALGSDRCPEYYLQGYCTGVYLYVDHSGVWGDYFNFLGVKK